MRRSRRVPLLVSATVAATALLATAVPAAAADEPSASASGSISGSAGIPGSSVFRPGASPYSDVQANNLVTFGDSFTANSHWIVNANPWMSPSYPRHHGCHVAPDAWPALAGAASGKPVQNWACNAHTTGQMLGRIDLAIGAGDINDTSTVVLAAGMNDKRRGVSDEQVVANLVTAVDKVREAAPDARVIILGRLPSTDPTGVFCRINVIPDLPRGGIDRATADAEAATQANQKKAAEEAGVQFIDIREMTLAGHSSCAPDADRFVSGTRDITTPGFNMTEHPSRAGSAFLAAQIAALLGQDAAQAIIDLIDDPELTDVLDEVVEGPDDTDGADGADTAESAG